MNELLWQPDPDRIARAKMTRFLTFVRQRCDISLAGYPELYRWSINHPASFWQAVWEFCEVRACRQGNEVVVDGDQMPGARWFPGARLNFAENLLRFQDDRRALVFWDEDGFQGSWTYAQLRGEVSRLAAALRGMGIQPGDRVAALLPNRPEAVIAMLAAVSLGAIWSSCSPDFGVRGVIDRFGQIEPRLLIAAEGYRYDGREFDLRERVRDLVAGLPTLERLVVVPKRSASDGGSSDVSASVATITWDDFLATGGPGEIVFEQLPFDHPVYILYSSGTTGPPKCIVHTAGGVLLQHLKELVLHTDLGRDDRLFYFTTCGWMMWNWLVSGLAVGCEVQLYDGSPLAPRPEILFDMAQQERTTVFGTSPRYLTAIAQSGLQPRKTHDLSPLRTILSTGSPLHGDGFDFVYQHIKSDVCLSSISGGTDLCSCFALGNPLTPVYRGELQTRGLGMRVEVFDESGRSVTETQGELVCTAPFPAMPLGFWRDPGGDAYRRAYFERYPGVWHHGDLAELSRHGGMVIYGRSDAVLKPGGVRIGTAEIYRQVAQTPEVLESVVVGQEWNGDVRIVLFVRLAPGRLLDESLVMRLKALIRRDATPRHVPAKILAVSDIPRTRSGKTVELAVRDVIHGRPVRNLEALANPEALEEFRNRPELAE
ncbi:MAG: acetoacetate--CoA ligase [Planctomycetales bacterium]